MVSIIIPTQNSSPTLGICLRSIQSQTYPHTNIVIVDGNSTDTTENIAKRYGAQVIRTHRSRSAARNIGAFAALGEYLLFLDSDMELTSDVISNCVETTRKHCLDGVMIPEVRVGKGFWAKCRALERATYVGDPLIESARFFQKKAILSLGAFDEDLEAGEDWDLQRRLEESHCKIGTISNCIRHHEGNLTLGHLVSKRYYYGKTIMKYVKKNSSRARSQFVPIRLNYIRNWRMLISNPQYALGMILMRMVENIAVMTAILASSTWDKRTSPPSG
ncbi:MAG TPA: glycosyltransferase [Candidatus Bathyarchaeia archaeon]|nr:glycosyltransferase [Candidatus Bathyarchaeia archaeon]